SVRRVSTKIARRASTSRSRRARSFTARSSVSGKSCGQASTSRKELPFRPLSNPAAAQAAGFFGSPKRRQIIHSGSPPSTDRGVVRALLYASAGREGALRARQVARREPTRGGDDGGNQWNRVKH